MVALLPASNKRRSWRKLHLGVDGDGFIVTSKLTKRPSEHRLGSTEPKLIRRLRKNSREPHGEPCVRHAQPIPTRPLRLSRFQPHLNPTKRPDFTGCILVDNRSYDLFIAAVAALSPALDDSPSAAASRVSAGRGLV